MRYKFIDTTLSQDDLEQIGRVELLKAAEEWSGVGLFELYAWTRVRRHVVDEIRRVMGRGQSVRGTAKHVTVESVAYKDIGGGRRVTADDRRDTEKLSCDDELRHDAHALLVVVASLPFNHRFVLVGRACGMKQHELAAQLGRTESRITQIETEARRMLNDVKEAA